MKTGLTATVLLVIVMLVVPGALYAQGTAPAAQPGDRIGEMSLRSGGSEGPLIGEAKVLEFAQSATVAPAQQGETRFDVVLTGVGANRIQAIKVVRALTGLGLKESRELVDNVPSIILRNVSQAEAEAAKVKLQAEGCTVEIKEKERSLFDVVLTGVGANRVQAIKVVQELTGLSLKESRELVDNVPSIILRNGGISQAVDATVKLQAEGCTVEIKETSFLMAIEDVSSIQGHGTVVTGRVERGVVRVGDKVEIVGLRLDTRRTEVVEIEISREEVEAVTQAQAGDNVRLLLRGIDRRDIEQGMMLAKPGSLKPHATFDAEVYVLREEEGGGHKAFLPGYQPQFSIWAATVTGEITPVGVGMVMPGDIAYMTVKLVTPVALEQGWWFQVREGGRTVGVGIVSWIRE